MEQKEENKNITRRKVKDATINAEKEIKKEKPTEINFDSTIQKKQKKNTKLIVCLILLVIIFIIGACFAMYKVFKIENTEKDYSKVQLQYTDTNKVASEGTYIVDVSEVVENVMPSIVAITSKTLVSTGQYGPFYYGGQQYATGAGSGIIVSKTDTELMVLTNYHVVEDATELSVQFINDKTADATVKGSSEARDIAIISIPLKSLDNETLSQIKLATIGDSSKMKVGNGVIAIGNALGYGQSVTTGVISALNRKVSIENSSNKMIQIDAAINGGNSGGALLNSKGEVIGINSAKYSSSGTSSQASIEGMGFAIPISDVKELITQLMNGETPKEAQKGYLGVQGSMTSNITNASKDIPTGFYITSVVTGSGADKAGIEVGNIITSIEGKEVKDFDTISNVLDEKEAGDKIKITIKYASGKEYKEKTVEVTLSTYSQVN